MKVYAPGKIILSGEHSVLYGQPALAMAVNRYATATITRQMLPQISFHLSDLAHRSRLSLVKLHELKERIKRKYHRFIRGEYTIKQVLHKPFELAQFALGIFAESFNMSLPHGVSIHVQSDIPIGCGMGSSAATILCIIHATSKYLQIPISSDSLFQLAMEAENMQHGQSSGLDLRVAIQGGCLYMQNQQFQTRSVPNLAMYLVNTGIPETSTGQCVESVVPHFQSMAFCDEFGAVTNALDAALAATEFENAKFAIQQNHQLLSSIGVVPQRVKQFVRETEAMHGAGKICGAGAIAGELGGAVLVLVEDELALRDLCAQYQYTVMPISGEARGVHAI